MVAIISSSRSGLLAILVTSSLIVLGISANLLNLATFHPHGDDDGDDDDGDGDRHRRMFGFETTDVAVAVLTLLTVIPILIMTFLSRRSVTSIVLFEISWAAILMILWVVSAGQTSGTTIPNDRCSGNGDDRWESFCIQFQAIQAFSWLNFIILLLWLTTVIVVAAIAHNRGHTWVWRYPLSDAMFLSKSTPHPEPEGRMISALSTQKLDRENLLVQSSQGGSTRIPTPSRQPKEYQGSSPPRQGSSPMAPSPQQVQPPTTPALPQV
ncbi:hypothetical protein JB92DRAFT_3146265 [Gautieria morchelliformis]|nr:hypothetical protein JB92DRAFT_3146265 [Gautieria morchelliformis]